ncbi:MAG: arylsulfatase [bacterium]|nr:arylsulfatase [bacterium]
MRAIRHVALSTLAAALVVTLPAQVAERPPVRASTERPNIVYILLDDAGWGDLGCYGQQKLKTPHMDRLAREGLRFTQHYAGSTVCAPTRSVLMTGQHTGHTPVRGNGRAPGEPENVFPIGGDAVTVAALLHGAGYATGCFGKWGLGGPGSDSDALALGFDHFCGFYNQAFAHDFYPRWLWRDGKKLELDRKVYAHDVIFDAALEFVRRNRERRFFCYLPVTIPHAAMQAPPEYHERFRKVYPEFDEKVGRYGGDDRRTAVRNPIAGFAAMMTKLDDDVGRLFGLLAELGLDDDTIVMLSSDNGPHREGGHDPKFWDSNGPFQGMKRSLYDGGIRVPLLARWPGRVAAGRVSDHISGHQDLLPTLCELAGASAPEEIDGISMVAELTGKGQQRQHDYLYWEFYEAGGKRAVRMQQWKAVQNGLRDDPDAPIELYDITTDAGERTNVAADHPAVVARAQLCLTEAHVADPRWRYRGKRQPKKGRSK